MLRYVLKRILASLLTIFFVATATFFVMHMVPGDPLADTKATTPEIRAQLMESYGLDKPLWEQYKIYLKNMAQGDFGVSYTQKNRSVNNILKEHFPVSAILGVLALIFATLGGVLWGALTALYRNKWPDYVIMFFVILGISVPNFVFAGLGQLLILKVNAFFGYEVMPVLGWGTFLHMLMPALVLGLGTMAFLSRLMRSSMLEVVNTEYVRTARSKGLGQFRIFWAHQLRNAVLPIVTVLGPQIAAITTGGFVVEYVFGIPGLGRSFVTAVHQLDYTVIMGLTVFYSAFLILMIMVVDIVYGFIDPRIRVEA